MFKNAASKKLFLNITKMLPNSQFLVVQHGRRPCLPLYSHLLLIWCLYFWTSNCNAPPCCVGQEDLGATCASRDPEEYGRARLSHVADTWKGKLDPAEYLNPGRHGEWTAASGAVPFQTNLHLHWLRHTLHDWVCNMYHKFCLCWVAVHWLKICQPPTWRMSVPWPMQACRANMPCNHLISKT